MKTTKNKKNPTTEISQSFGISSFIFRIIKHKSDIRVRNTIFVEILNVYNKKAIIKFVDPKRKFNFKFKDN